MGLGASLQMTPAARAPSLPGLLAGHELLLTADLLQFLLLLAVAAAAAWMVGLLFSKALTETT
jgi:hypothetical protein